MSDAPARPRFVRAQAEDAQPLARGAGAGLLLYLDAGSGVAGDMLVAALCDLGVPEQVVTQALSGLPLEGYACCFSQVTRAGIGARRFEVVLGAEQPPRDYAGITKLLASAASLTEGARALAQDAFLRLALAEARVHRVPLSEVHFHEVGAVDSIVDIVAACALLDYLGATVRCSPLPLGRGVASSAHGAIPLPAPATLECLRDVPTCDAGVALELVTPTGACLVAAAAASFGGWPAFAVQQIGYGAGTRDTSERPNALRAVLGRPTSAVGRCVVLEANVDDMSAELAAHTQARMLELGALDAWATPIVMKKGRAALTLSVLCKPSDRQSLTNALLAESTSLGLRSYEVERVERAREIVSVETPYGPIAVKVAAGDGIAMHAAPEYEACRRAAQEHGVPLRVVYAAAQVAYARQCERTRAR